jgi:prolyl oligopeptidase
MKYPFTRKVDVVDDFHGTKVPDPYRWLEEAESSEVKEWIGSQNDCSDRYFQGNPWMPRIRQRLGELLVYTTRSIPVKSGDYYYFTERYPQDACPSLFRAASLDGQTEIVIDKSQFGQDENYLPAYNSFSPNGRYVCYGAVDKGGDWLRYRVKDLVTLEDTGDVIIGSTVHCPNFKWRGEEGFYYWRYTAKEEGTGRPAYRETKVYWHQVGTQQDEDDLVYELPAEPDIRTFPFIQTDDKYLALLLWNNADPEKNRFLYRPIGSAGPFKELLIGGSFQFLGNEGESFYFETNNNAHKGRVVAIDINRPEQDYWKTIVPEQETEASCIYLKHGVFLVHRQEGLSGAWSIHNSEGKCLVNPEIPGTGRVSDISDILGEHIYYEHTSWLDPYSVYQCDIKTGATSLLWRPEMGFDFGRYKTELVYYSSQDGVKIPMYLTSRCGAQKNGDSPVLLEGYGYAGSPAPNNFQLKIIAWLEQGGIYAWACVRGGGDLGKEWHEAGKRERKKTTFDDFAAAARWLVGEGYTIPSRLAIGGSSWGGALVSVAMEQHPELYGAVVCHMPLTDMLRQHRSGVGGFWLGEFGDPEKNERDFDNLMSFSPLQNISGDESYPAAFITCGDNDQRVPPHHAYKFAAAMQEANPDGLALLRVEKAAGHTTGGVSSKRRIEAMAEELSFLLDKLNIEP